VEKNTFASSSKFSFDEYDDGGIILALGGPYIVYGNILKGLNIGIVYEGASRSLVYNNSIIQNLVGITLLNYRFINSTSGGMDNIFFSNNLIDNQRQVVVEIVAHGISVLLNGTDVVSWDNGVVGNFWSDYLSRYPNATQNNNTGTYNTPYIIDANNKDNHPLFSPRNTSGE
jgi:nitrous oxidase accessory protein NosD